MWHKAEWMGHPMRLELTRVGLLVKLASRYTTRGVLITMVIKHSDSFKVLIVMEVSMRV